MPFSRYYHSISEDEMIGWHHWLNGHEFEQAPGAGNGQGSLACCSPWDRKELDMTEQLNWTELQTIFKIQAVHPKGNQSWIFIGRTDAEAETPILRPPDGKNWLTGKDPDAGKDWRQEEKGMIEDKMVGWHHQCNGHEFESAPGVGDGQGSLVCYSPWSCKELDTTG